MTALDGPLSHAIGLAVLHLLWQGTLVAAVLAIALRLLARSSANLRYAIACGALASFVAFGVGTAYRMYEPATAYVLNDEIISVFDDQPAVDTAAAPLVQNESLADKIQRYSPTIAIVWLLGVVVLATKLTISWTRARGLASIGVADAPPSHQRTLDSLSQKLGITRAVRLLESVAVDVPSVVGFLKPVVLVPASSLSGLSPRQLELILAHELAHIRRHDFLVNMLQSVAETLLFFHPAAWWVSAQIRIERENCCDDLAVATCGNALEYARALTLLEQLRSASPLAVAANGGSLLGRVRRLVSRGDGRSINGWTAVAAAVSFAVVMTITSLPARADREAPPAPPAPPPAAEIEVIAPEPAPEPPEPEEADEVPTPRPARAPRPQRLPVIAVSPAPAIAPLPPMVIADFDADFDYEMVDSDDQEAPAASTPPGRLSVEDLIALRVHGITPEYINEMRALFSNITIRQVTSLKVMGVSTKYVADMKAAGVDIKTAREATSLRAQNVTPEFVRSLAAAGYTKLTVRDLTRLAAAGVNADFIRDMQKYRNDK
jgi:beta-lactamase regulating signal transducer with metallopeptidase domain